MSTSVSTGVPTYLFGPPGFKNLGVHQYSSTRTGCYRTEDRNQLNQAVELALSLRQPPLIVPTANPCPRATKLVPLMDEIRDWTA